MSKKSYSYELRKAGSVAFVIDDGKPFVLQKTEKRLENGIEVEFHVVDVIVPVGADQDKSFVKNINNAKSIKEVINVCESWVNV